jgi:uncharacterized protein (TIRG00374 family)
LKRPGWYALFVDSSAAQPAARRQRFIFGLSIVLAAIFLFLALRKLDWQAFFSILSNTRYAYLPLLLVWISLIFVLRAARWRILVQAEQPVPLADVFWANMSGYLGNNVLPARAGELIRAAYLGKKSGISTSFVFATGLAERLVDMVTLLLLGTLSLASSGITSPELETALRTVAAIGGVGFAVLLILPRFGKQMETVIAKLPLPSNSLKQKLSDLAGQFLRGLGALVHARRALAFGLLTLLIWLMDAAGMVMIGFMLRVPISLPQSFVLLAGLGLSSAIPSTPGYVGVFQFVAVVVLGPFGFPPADAVALVLFSQVCTWLIVLALGGTALAIASKWLGHADPAAEQQP